MSEHRLRDETGTVRVNLTAHGDATAVRVDEAPEVLTRIHRGPRSHHAGTTTEAVSFALEGRPIRALVTRGLRGVTVVIEGQTFTFACGDDGDAPTAGRLGSGIVTAPMPGKIIAVLVREGEPVTVGQALIVLEAMKMESTLSAEVAGEVTRVTVTTGDLVDGGTLLVAINTP